MKPDPAKRPRNGLKSIAGHMEMQQLGKCVEQCLGRRTGVVGKRQTEGGGCCDPFNLWEPMQYMLAQVTCASNYQHSLLTRHEITDYLLVWKLEIVAIWVLKGRSEAKAFYNKHEAIA